MSISINEAHTLIEELKQQEISLGRNPKTWYTYENHVVGTAKLARMIASEIETMNHDRLYVRGLLHDICRTEEDRKQRFHGILGYEKLRKKDEEVARICLLHMFPWNKLPPYDKCSNSFYHKKEDYDFISEYIAENAPTDEDYLIQLCDSLAGKDGFVTIEQRAEDYIARHRNINTDEIISRNELKQYFDKKVGHSIYDFYKTTDISAMISKVNGKSDR